MERLLKEIIRRYRMSQTNWITLLGCIAAASAAVSQIPDITGSVKLVCVCIAAVCGASCAYLAKGKDTEVQS
jgi:hypothetical protein